MRDYDGAMLRRWLALGCALAALASLPARATPSTLEECVEGADFIGNAAYSRDNGMAREASVRNSRSTNGTSSRVR